MYVKSTMRCWWNWVVDECYTDYGMLIELLISLANGIRYRWPSCVWWLVSTNNIQYGWPGCDCWFQDGWQGCDCWLASTNGIQDGWPSWLWWLASANGICKIWRVWFFMISFGLMASETDNQV